MSNFRRVKCISNDKDNAWGLYNLIEFHTTKILDTPGKRFVSWLFTINFITQGKFSLEDL